MNELPKKRFRLYRADGTFEDIESGDTVGIELVGARFDEPEADGKTVSVNSAPLGVASN